VFSKILIANRGEIALRIIRTCKRLDVASVAVYSEVDFRAPFVREADERECIGKAFASESYLDKGAIIKAALEHQCDAVHPGYGFLSENPEFARMVADAGLTFIGPSPEAIALLGDKPASKALAKKAGVPVVPGHDEPLSDLEEAVKVAEQLGFPLLLKPAAGGGGRGMRIVQNLDELPSAFVACRDEAKKGFSDERLFLERYVMRPRHIEIQIVADRHGNVIHLGERECSVQRRYQKVVEETPSLVLNPALRDKMGRVACNLAREAGYTNAGTVEFIVDGDRNFYFLEMNTRLQVEHPVTEEVTGLDLVALQLEIASGEPLPVKQEDVKCHGWAIEARVCAEDPFRGFLPTTGMVTRYAAPSGRNVRVDAGIEAGSVIGIYYDSLLAKVVAWGEDRESARKRLVRALNGYHIEGLTTNVDFVNAVIDHPAFASGDLSTDFIDEHFEDGRSKTPPGLEKIKPMLMAAVLIHYNRRNLVRDSLKPMKPVIGAKEDRKKQRNYVVKAEEQVFSVHLEREDESRNWTMEIDGESHEIVAPDFEFYRRRLRLLIDGEYHMFRMSYQQSHIQTFYCGIIRTFEVYTPREWSLTHFMIRKEQEVVENLLKCPMPGLVTAVCVAEGEYVRRGQELFRIESMKMESSIASPVDAQVEKILASPGNNVETDEILLTFTIN
jgi:propionyl-CoA carboxylase alpha chain